MNFDGIFEKVARLINSQPEVGIWTSLGIAIIVGVLILFRRRKSGRHKSVVEEILTRPGKYSSFTMTVELIVVFITILAIVSWLRRPETESTWIKIIVLVLFSAGFSWAMLEWGSRKDKA